MESLIGLRGSYRSAFTLFTGKVQDFLKQKICNFTSCADFLVQLQVKYNKIKCLDKEILAMMQGTEKCSQEVLEVEMKGIENYNNVFVDLKIKLIKQVNLSYINSNETSKKVFADLKTKLKRHLHLTNDDPNEPNQKVRISTSEKNCELPQIQLQTFDGNLKNWLSFWRSFEKIHHDKSISEVDKYTYLLEAIQKGSKAREMVEFFPLTSERYQKAIVFLHSHFGREDLLIEVHIREILSLVVCKSLGQEYKVSVRKIYEKIEAPLRSLKMLGVASDKYASVLYSFVEYSLPVDLLHIWRRLLNSEPLRSDKKNHNKLEILMQFLRNIIREKEKINLTESAFGFEKQTIKKMKISVTPEWNC